MSIELAIAVVAAGVVVGVLSALFGVGGGILMVPLMVLVLHEDQHVAEGTSLLVIVPTAVAGVLAHRRRGYVSFKTAGLLAAGGIAGAWLGALLALELEADVLQSIFGVVMLVVSARLMHQGLAQMRRERRARTGASQAPNER